MNNRMWVIAGLVAISVGAVWASMGLRKDAGQIKETGEKVESVDQLLAQAAAAHEQGDQLKEKQAYTQIVSDHADYDKVEEIQQELNDLNIALITSNTPLPQTVAHEVKPGDSLGKLAAQYNTTKELIKKSNNLSSDVIRVGQKLRVWNALFTITVDKSQNTLVLRSNDETIKVYRVSTGVNNSTPVGVYKIASKIPSPVWFKAGSAPIPAESPENQLGSRWMGFDVNPHYGIHGTVDPERIGQQATAGCVRMRNVDVEELFDLVPRGAQVTIKD